jgi:hypothetical protein
VIARAAIGVGEIEHYVIGFDAKQVGPQPGVLAGQIGDPDGVSVEPFGAHIIGHGMTLLGGLLVLIDSYSFTIRSILGSQT